MKAPAPIGSAACARTGRGARARRQSGRVRACLVILALAAGFTGAQEAEEPSELDRVLAMHYEARGGLEKLRSIQGARATGTMSVQGIEAPFTIQRASTPNQVRVEGDFGGMALIQAFDGEQAWGQAPGQPRPVAFEGEVAAAQAADATLSSPWFEYTELGYEVELAGREEIESGEAWKLVVTAPGGVAHQVFIGTEDGLEKKRISRADFGFGLEDSETRFEDYRDVNGLVLAHRQILVSSLGEMPLTLEFLRDQPRDRSGHLLHAGADGGCNTGPRRGPGAPSDRARQFGRRGRDGERRRHRRPARLRGADDGGLRAARFLPHRHRHAGSCRWSSPTTARPLGTCRRCRASSSRRRCRRRWSGRWGSSPTSCGAGSRARGEAALAGIEKVERDETYRLDILTADGEARALYLGGEDFLERRVVFEGAFLQSAGEIDVTIADYMDAGGLKVPGRIRIAVEGAVAVELRIQEAEAGAEIDPASFTMPAPADPETPGPAL